MANLSPLDGYRRRATFDVEALRVLLEDEDVVQFRYQVWDTMGKDPLFTAPISEELTLEQERELIVKQIKRLSEYGFDRQVELTQPMKLLGYFQAMQAHSMSLFVQYVVLREVSGMCIAHAH